MWVLLADAPVPEVTQHPSVLPDRLLVPVTRGAYKIAKAIDGRASWRWGCYVRDLFYAHASRPWASYPLGLI